MTWADPPQSGALENVYPPDNATINGLEFIYPDLTNFIAQTPVRSQASQWQFSNNDPTFTTVAHDTGTVLFEPVYQVYNILDATVQLDTEVVGGNTQIPPTTDALEKGDVYWRARFQNIIDSAWTDWTTPTSFQYEGHPMIIASAGSPGVQAGQYDVTTDTGYYGFVPASEFITGLDLATLTGFTAGTNQNSDAGWLKFYVGPTAVCNTTPGTAKCIFIAKQTLKHSASWNQINTAGLVYGTRNITVLGQTYSVRLMTGGTVLHGTDSEWPQFMYRVHVDQPGNNDSWGTFSDSELSVAVGNGFRTWTQERIGTEATYWGFSITNWYKTNSSTTAIGYGWRPVLELVE